MAGLVECQSHVNKHNIRMHLPFVPLVSNNNTEFGETTYKNLESKLMNLTFTWLLFSPVVFLILFHICKTFQGYRYHAIDIEDNLGRELLLKTTIVN